MNKFCTTVDSGINFARYDVGESIWKCHSSSNDDDTDRENACIGDNGERMECAVGFGRVYPKNDELTAIINAGCPEGKLD